MHELHAAVLHHALGEPRPQHDHGLYPGPHTSGGANTVGKRCARTPDRGHESAPATAFGRVVDRTNLKTTGFDRRLAEEVLGVEQE